MVITALTRNQVYRQRYRGFESHPLRQKKRHAKACLFFFLAFMDGICYSIGIHTKYRTDCGKHKGALPCGKLCFPQFFPDHAGPAGDGRGEESEVFFMKKRLLSGLLLLAMLLALLPTMALADNVVNYGIYIERYDYKGTGVTSENCADVFKDGTVSYDPETKTLTLNNARLVGISAESVDLTMRLVGRSIIYPSWTEGSLQARNLTVMGSGSLELVRDEYFPYAGIQILDGGIYTQNSGTVTTSGRKAGFISYLWHESEGWKLDGKYTLRLNGGVLNLEKGTDGFFCGNPTLELPEGTTLTLKDENGNTIETVTLTGNETTQDLLTLLSKASSVTMERPVEKDKHPSLAEGAILLAGDDNPFRDVRAIDWYYEDVMYAYRRGLMNGTAYARFSPDGTFTRGMLLTILARYDGVRTEKGAAWYEAGCAWAAENGISDGKNPGEAISREEFAEVLYRYATYLGKDTLAGADLSSYLDADELSDTAVRAMQWAVGEAIVRGHDFCLYPQDGTTRAEACAMLHRFFRA